ncbi:hypothetical protein [Litoribrevibacter albus]|uniref:ABC transporter substrate-binding protein n=1 Tax=Litoribrevibacter albus TaxID=1473156 RepID=A0AA37S7H3_9GAMM|nr:hypothetical protein [Litoribrevibacter albus]GLQ29633.1 hypothetical protein GCM10007876_01110 [Litoribrevibacter albus]
MRQLIFLILFVISCLAYASTNVDDTVTLKSSENTIDKVIYEAQKVAIKYFQSLEIKDYRSLVDVFEKQTIKSKANMVRTRSSLDNPIIALSNEDILINTTKQNMARYDHVDFKYHVLGGVREGQNLVHFTVKQVVTVEGSSRKYRYITLTLNNYSGSWKVEPRRKIASALYNKLYGSYKGSKEREPEDLVAFKLLW